MLKTNMSVARARVRFRGMSDRPGESRAIEYYVVGLIASYWAIKINIED